MPTYTVNIDWAVLHQMAEKLDWDRVNHAQRGGLCIGYPTSGPGAHSDIFGGTYYELRFSAEESGNPDGVAELIQEMLEKANSSRVVGFTWAETCSKFWFGEFSGGAVVINRNGTDFLSASSWMDKMVDEMEGK